MIRTTDVGDLNDESTFMNCDPYQDMPMDSPCDIDCENCRNNVRHDKR